MTVAVFPDNTVLCNFAAVRRLDLLEGVLRGRGRWTEAVAAEALNSSRHLPDLATIHASGWLGEPIEIDDESAIAHIEHLRIDVFGGTAAFPRSTWVRRRPASCFGKIHGGLGPGG